MRPIIVILVLSLCVSSFAAVETQPAPTEVEQLRSQIVLLKAQVADLQRQLAEAKAGKVATTRSAVNKPMTEIDKAIAEHRLVNGMTLQQAQKAMGSGGMDIGQPSQGHGTMQWSTDKGTVRASIDNSIVTHWEEKPTE